ncbi:MAG: beta-ketoacyl synthase N-terminal-like domain-containing protein, partial [Cyanobacteria bacterium P01_F01_bin.42]
MRDFSTFVDLLQCRSQQSPDRVVLSYLQDGEVESTQLTYGDLDRKARAIAAQLQDQGLAGERALLLYAPNLDFVAGFFGCLYANVIAVPAYPPRSAQMLTRLTAIIEDAQAAIALSSSTIIDNVTQRLSSDEVGKTIRCIATDQIDEQESDQWQRPQLSGEQLAFLQYTSGSTGNPKGVMVSHGNLIHNSQLIQESFEHQPDCVGVTWLPPYHDMGLVGGILQPIFVGFKMAMMPPVAFIQRPVRWLSAISKLGAMTSGGPNFAYDLCVKQVKPEQLEELDLSSWNLAFSGAEPVRAETIDAFSETFAPCGFRREAFFPCYGMAETTLIVSGAKKMEQPVIQAYDEEALGDSRAVESKADDAASRALTSSGKAIADLKLAIVDPDTEIALPENKIGEIWVSSESVTQGYWRKPELTQTIFHGSPKSASGDSISGKFLRTGDLGFLANGELFVAGRIKDLIIIRGRNYYPQDIELSAQAAHPSLRVGCVAAFSIDHDGEEQLVIVQEVERTWLRKIDVEEVTLAIQQAVVADHQLQPHAIVLLKTGGIPKTSSGKIQRYACRQRYLNQSLKVVGDRTAKAAAALPKAVAAPRTEEPKSAPSRSSIPSLTIQSWLTEQLIARTGIQTVDITEPLSRYGLDSLAAVRLTAELEDWLVERFALSSPPGLAATLAYDYPTILQISDYVAQYVGGGDTTPESANSPHVNDYSPSVQDADDVAIIGFGCRFPGAENPDAYWELLEAGQSGISRFADRQADRTVEAPPAAQGGFLPQVDQFDASFFGISPREAEHMDPQQRLLLEVAWESLEHAGLTQEKLTGSNTGVFVGISSSDYAQLTPSDETSVYAGTGKAHSIAANRLSYFLDLRGPSLAVDTACSSSLVAIHLASQSLRYGDCSQAIAAGVNILLDGGLTETFTQSGMLSPDGKCKTFDQDADGYVRGEGCGVVVLKRLRDAQKDGDRIWGVIRGSAVNQDGRSNGLTAPNGRAQQAVIQQAIARAKIQPNQISYVETHGTGTSLGDPIEVNALKQVLTQGRQKQPCWISSVKTNLGHLEAAAGIAGVIKVLLAIEHRIVPPHLHFSTLNPLIQIDQTGIEIPTQVQPWTDETRYAGVSSFGFGGTNAHLILSTAPVTSEQPSRERPWHLLTLSAKTKTALASLQRQYGSQQATWAQLSTRTNAFRSQLSQRVALLAPDNVSVSEIQSVLSSGQSAESTDSSISLLEADESLVPNLAFLFTGQGAQYVAMGRELFESSPDFRKTIETCDEILKPLLDGQSLVEILYNSADETGDRVNQTAVTQPALFAVEYALAQLWLSWGIRPNWVMGHSIGEYVAACIAGVFSLEDGLKLIAARARLMDNIAQSGGMLVAFAAPERVQPHIDKTDLTIAAYNGPENTVISGDSRAIAALEMTLHQAQ